MKTLTVSIAAYNVENYIEETLQSLCDTRYINDIEVLIIDDGSKDNTGNISMKYQEMYPDSIHYIKKENGGHGSTINKGIELATGKYFRVLDGDDYVDCDNFYSYIEKLKKCDLDLVITNYCWVDNSRNKFKHNHKIFDELQTNTELEFNQKYDSSLFGLSTLSIKTNLLKESNLKITEKCFYVDVEFLIWAIYLSKTYTYFNDEVYMYRCVSTNQNSVSKKNMIRNIDMQKKVALKLCTLFEEFQKNNIDEDKKKIILDRITMSIGAVYRTYLLFDSYGECKKNILKFNEDLTAFKEIYDYTSKNLFISFLRFNKSFNIFIFRMIYNIYLKIKNIFTKR